MFIINFCLYMFRASLYPSSGEQRPCYCIWCTALVLLDVVGSGCGALRCRMRALCHRCLPRKRWETAVAQWLRCCATNRKVTGSIPASVSGFFIDMKFFRLHYGPGVDSASNRNEYQEYFLGVEAAGA